MPYHSKSRVRSGRGAGAAWRLAAACLILLPLAAAAREDKLPPPEGSLARTDHGGDGVEVTDG